MCGNVDNDFAEYKVELTRYNVLSEKFCQMTMQIKLSLLFGNIFCC